MSVYKCLTCDNKTIHGWDGWTCDSCGQKNVPKINKFQDALISISRVQSGDKDEVNIRLIPEDLVGESLDMRLSLENFSKAIFGDIHINCKVRKG